MILFRVSWVTPKFIWEPAIPPKNAHTRPINAIGHITVLLRIKLYAAVAVPNTAGSLFVATAIVGERPASIKAGTRINQPPPAILSIKPAQNEAAIKNASI